MGQPHFIVFANEKGGTGKSTTAVHTAVALAATGRRVAQLVAEVVDLAREDQGREGRDLGRDRRDSVRVVPRGLLLDGQSPPVVECVKLLEHPLSLSAHTCSPGPRDGSLPPHAAGVAGSRFLTVDAYTSS